MARRSYFYGRLIDEPISHKIIVTERIIESCSLVGVVAVIADCSTLEAAEAAYRLLVEGHDGETNT